MAGGNEEQSDQTGNQSNGSTPITEQTKSNSNFNKIEFPKLSDNHSVEYWFIRIESWFRLQNISDESVRFEAIVASLTPQLFDQVVDLIINRPEDNPYQKLKTALIEKFTDSEYTRVDKLLSTVPLGAQRPSHLLAEIRRAGATQDDKILRVCWLRRLPATIRAVLSASKAPLGELAEMADATYDTLQIENINQLSVANNATATTTTLTGNSQVDLIKCIESLSQQIGELKATVVQKQNYQSRGRQRSENRHRSSSTQRRERSPSAPAANRQPTCWYHRNFGTQSTKCQPPCDFPMQPPPTSKP